MSTAKPKQKIMPKGRQQEVLKKNLNIGDVIKIEWMDVIGLERQTMDDIKALIDPEVTRSYGVVVRLMEKSLALAHELGDSQSDGFQVSIYPYGLITALDVLGHEEITLG